MKFEKFSDLSRRVTYAVTLLIVLLLLITNAGNLYVSVLVVLAVSVMAGVGVWEYGILATAKGLKPALALMSSVAVCEVIAFFIAHKWFNSPELPVFIIALGLALFILCRFRKTENSLIHVAVEFFGVVYVALPLSYMLCILYPIGPATPQDGRWWLLYLVLVTKVADMGAYFVGKIWGRKRLAPLISPNKTIEGAIGGLVSSIGLSLLLVFLGRKYAGIGFSIEYIDGFWLGILLGIFGQLGDLAESMFKRDAHVKDSNKIPGLGGVLDVVDSLIFTAPIIYFYLKFYSGTL